MWWWGRCQNFMSVSSSLSAFSWKSDDQLINVSACIIFPSNYAAHVSNNFGVFGNVFILHSDRRTWQANTVDWQWASIIIGRVLPTASAIAFLKQIGRVAKRYQAVIPLLLYLITRITSEKLYFIFSFGREVLQMSWTKNAVPGKVVFKAFAYLSAFHGRTHSWVVMKAILIRDVAIWVFFGGGSRHYAASPR